MDGFFITYFGYELDPNNINSENIDIRDISHSLARICRFNGHITTFYSVAQHSITVSRMLGERGYDSKIQLCGLLHDASEAYLGDIPTPIKKCLKDYKKLEIMFQQEIFKHFNLFDIWNSSKLLIKKFDDNVLINEWKILKQTDCEKTMQPYEPNMFDKVAKEYLEMFYMLL